VFDWKAMNEDWIGRIRSDLIPELRADQRFVDSAVLAARFDASVERWGRGSPMRQVINDANELAAARALLNHMKLDDELFYEPRLKATPKTIDFLVRSADGMRYWIDVKTVAPTWRDDDAASARIQSLLSDLPGNTLLVTGAGNGNQGFNARFSFITRSVEFEQKLALLTDDERGFARLLLCTSGEWRLDDLEDFADFYHTHRFRQDDWSRNAVARYMREKALVLRHTIAGFCYLKRRHDETVASRFVLDVHGPAELPHIGIAYASYCDRA
jgi:hypothetical protein